MQIRPLTTLEECRQVAALERTVWGYTDAEDVVPPPVLIVSIKRGGILLGAFDDGGAMRGFVYSMPAIKNGRPTQWSHMLGVMPEMRAAGLGARLKLAQRQAALDMGLDLIEWTYDPLQAAQRSPQFLQARHRGRGVRREHLRRVDERAAPRHADRSLRRGVEAARAARRAPDCGGRRSDSPRQLGGRRRQSSTRRCQGSRGCGQGRRISMSRNVACWSRFPSASRKCSSATRRWRCDWRMSTRAALPGLFRPRLSGGGLLSQSRCRARAVFAGPRLR